jgi:hypothetical protein
MRREQEQRCDAAARSRDGERSPVNGLDEHSTEAPAQSRQDQQADRSRMSWVIQVRTDMPGMPAKLTFKNVSASEFQGRARSLTRLS